ncbi:MAG: hypothetical protein QM784_23945 [Polyangiaceae bacterium]
MGRLLDATAIVFPCVLWGLAWPLVRRLLPELYDVAAWPLACFIVARSIFSLRQVEAYSYVDWRVQVRQLAILLFGLSVVATLPIGEDAKVLGVSLALTSAAYFGRRGCPNAVGVSRRGITRRGGLARSCGSGAGTVEVREYFG